MTTVLSSKRFWFLAVVLILFMLTAFPAAAFADENEGSAANNQDTETECSAAETPQLQDYSPPTFEAPASTDFTPADFPQNPSAPSDSDLSGAVDPEMKPDNGNETDTPATGNSYIAEISPDAVVNGGTTVGYTGYQAGETGKPFNITFTEVGDKQIGSAQVKMPDWNADDGFKDFYFNPLTGITTSSGQSWSGELVNSGGSYYLNLWAQSASDYLAYGESVSATFTATTPIIDGVYEFKTKAWTTIGVDFSTAGDNNMAEGYSDPFVVVGKGVGNPTDLNNVRNGLSGYYIQTADIDLSAFGAGYDDGKGWLPIGSSTTPFTGSYNGQNYAISNLFINRPTTDNQGLFGYTNGATLTDIVLTNADITGKSSVGGLVGFSLVSAINNCHAAGSVKGDSVVGGLVGYNYNGTITKSSASGSIKGNDYVGGLVGYNYNGTITKSSASVSVQGNDYVGGLVGLDDTGTITKSSASGSVIGNNNVGGLVGRNWNIEGTVENSYATGDVTGNYQVGGLVGNHKGLIKNSYATGRVIGNGNTGGLIGLNWGDGTIENSYAIGDVTGNYQVGGLVGQNIGVITNSYAAGVVTFTEGDKKEISNIYIGGLVGINHGTINNSYAAFAVDGADKDGLVGYNNGTVDTQSGIKPIDEIKTLAFHVDVLSWYTSTTTTTVNRGGYNPYPFPRLFWELGIGNSPIWYIYPVDGENGDDQGGGDSGGHSGREPGTYFGFTFAPAPFNSPVGALTRIPGQDANAIITAAFVTGGSAADLNKAIAAFNQAKQSYDTNKGTLGAADKAVAEVELAIADAAIKALSLSLAAQGGQAFDLATLISAYNNAAAVLNANSGLLTAEQIAEAEALLQAIATVISRYST